MDLTLRPATNLDADDLAETVAEGFATYAEFAPEGWTPPDRLELAIGIAVRLRSGDQRAWVAVDARESVAGQVAYLPAARSRHRSDDPGLAHLAQLFVRRAHWGTGLAARLLAVAIDAATADGYTAMRLFTPDGQIRARRFYEREGWRPVGQPVLEPSLGLDLVEYRRPLEGSDLAFQHPETGA